MTTQIPEEQTSLQNTWFTCSPTITPSPGQAKAQVQQRQKTGIRRAVT